jgi:hypothetical protein
MTGTTARLVRIGTALLGLAAFGWFLSGRAAETARQGLPTDWSHQHLVFSRPATAEQAERVAHDPRYWQQWYRRNVAHVLTADPNGPVSVYLNVDNPSGQGLWSEGLGSGASVGAGNYPAKYSFDATQASCANDYVVFTTSLAGSSGQASVVAYKNLYSGCTAPVPQTYWAYNTGGPILTSPVISEDGTQVAFAQSIVGGGQAYLVLLKFASGGTVSAPVPLTPVATTSYRGCAAPCMTEVPLVDSHGTVLDDQTSSAFPDYKHDTIWVGGAVGWLHKITGVFRGTPAEVRTGGFPVQVNPGNPTSLSNPVYDYASTYVFVGDYGGYFYRVNSSTAAVTTSAELDFGAGIVSGPVVDSTNGLVYVYASSDGSGACTAGADCAGVYQLTTTFTSGSSGSEVTVGNSTIPGTTPNPLYIGGFDSAYYNSTNATGNMYVCGNTGGNPTLYQIPIQAGVMPPSGLGLAVSSLSSSSSTAPCSPVTDVPNPNTSGGPSEHLFAGVQDQGTATACASGGCVFTIEDAPWTAKTAYIVGQETLDSKLHIETVITAGTSGTSVPIWGNSAGTTRTDGGVVWINQGAFSASPFATWLPSHSYSSATGRIIDSNGNIEVSTTTGKSGSSAPTWNTTPGGTTSDHTVTWTNAGTVASFALSAAGGTSAIIVDNIVGSGTLAGASQVYFSTLSDQTCTTSGNTGGCAIQASQTALQ